MATRLLTHTQVLDDDVAILTQPEPEAFAEAILTLARDPARASELGVNARRRAGEKYSYERYLESTRQVFDFISRLREAGTAAPSSTCPRKGE